MKIKLMVGFILGMGFFAGVATAATTFTNLNGDITLPSNWDNGVPVIGNQGTIGIDATRLTNNVVGWDMVVASGATLYENSTNANFSYWTTELQNSTLEIQAGGGYVHTNSGTTASMRIGSNSTINVTGGTVLMDGFVSRIGGFTFNMEGGSCSLKKSTNYGQGTNGTCAINVSGGTMDIGVLGNNNRTIKQPNTLFNISGGSLILNDLSFVDSAGDTNIIVTISGSGQLETIRFDNRNRIHLNPERYINFVGDEGVTASWKWTGKGQSDFEKHWNQGTLRHNGESGVTGEVFAEHFVVSGDVITIAPPPPGTNFTDGSGDGLWTTLLNWDDGVPDSGKIARVNGNLTADLNGTLQTAQRLYVGSEEGESGRIANGTLTVGENTSIASRPNATGVVNVVTYTAGNSKKAMDIAIREETSGSLVIGTAAIQGSTLQVGTEIGSTGKIDAGSGTLTFAGAVDVGTGVDSIGLLNLGSSTFTIGNSLDIGTGTSASGVVEVATFNMDTTNLNLTIGGNVDAYGRLVANSASIDTAILRLGTSSNAVGLLYITNGTVSSTSRMDVGTAQDSTGTLNAPSLVFKDGADLRIALGKDSVGLVDSPSLVFDGSGYLQIAAGQNSVGTLKTDTLGMGSGSLNIATASNSTATLTIANPIVLNQTNALFVGTGLASSHNLTLADFNITEPIGSFSVGPGTAPLDAIINLYDSIGTLRADVPLTITAKDHQLTGITKNAPITFSGGTHTFIGGGGLGVATIAGVNQSLDPADFGAAGAITSGTINVASGSDTIASFSYADGSLKSGGINIATGVRSDGTFLVSNGDLVAGVITVAGGDDSVGTFTHPSGTLSLSGLNVARGDNAVGSFTYTVGDLTGSGTMNIASGGSGADATVLLKNIASTNAMILEICDDSTAAGSTGTVTVLEDAIVGYARVGRGNNAIATLDIADLLTVTNGNIVSATGSNSVGRITAVDIVRSGGNKTISVGSGMDSDGSIVASSSFVHTGTARNYIGSGIRSKASLIAPTIEISSGDLWVGSGDHSVAKVEATTLTIPGTKSFMVADGDYSDGCITASFGTLTGKHLRVARGEGSTGLFGITNGTVTLSGTIDVATDVGASGTLLASITTTATNNVNIATRSNAVANVTLSGGTITAARFDLATGSNSVANVLILGGSVTANELNIGLGGVLTLEGASLAVMETGTVDSVEGYVNITDVDSTFTWVGKVESDFMTLWNAGALRANGESGLTGAVFADYFAVSGDALFWTPVGHITILPATAGMLEISWLFGVDGQSYDIEYKNNLVINPVWLVETNVTGTAGAMSVVVPTVSIETFYRVSAP